MRPRTSRVLGAVDQAVSAARRRADKHVEDPITDAQWCRLEDALRVEFSGAMVEWFEQDRGPEW